MGGDDGDGRALKLRPVLIEEDEKGCSFWEPELQESEPRPASLEGLTVAVADDDSSSSDEDEENWPRVQLLYQSLGQRTVTPKNDICHEHHFSLCYSDKSCQHFVLRGYL
jgi:hypothetical protein